MSDVPLAAYEDPRWMPTNETPVGNRGFTGNPAVLTTVTGQANTDLVISAKDCAYGNDPSIKVQYAVLANGAPQALYEDGYPAMLVPPTDLGFKILMKRAGTWGNYFTLTLVNPGQPSPLKISRPAAKNVVITLAYATGAITSTPATIITAINTDPELSEYMTAFASSATVGALTAGMAQMPFTGGMDVPGLVLISLVNVIATGVSTATGLGVMNLLNGSRYVTAKPAGASTNAGIVPAFAATLTGPGLVGSANLSLNTPNRGDVSEQYLARRSAFAKRRRAGDPLGKETNKTLQLRDSRFGATRNYQRVPKQDRAVVNASPLSLQTDRLAAHTLG